MTSESGQRIRIHHDEAEEEDDDDDNDGNVGDTGKSFSTIKARIIYCSTVAPSPRWDFETMTSASERPAVQQQVGRARTERMRRAHGPGPCWPGLDTCPGAQLRLAVESKYAQTPTCGWPSAADREGSALCRSGD